MTVISTDVASRWAVLLGALTIVCWLAAGLTAVLTAREEIRHGKRGKIPEFLTRGLAGVGLCSVVVMTAVLVVA
jgi:hypothetical protein